MPPDDQASAETRDGRPARNEAWPGLDHYGAVLALTLASLVISALVSQTNIGGLAAFVVQWVVLYAAYAASGVGRKTLRVASAVIVLVLVGAAALVAYLPYETGYVVLLSLVMVASVVAPVIVARRLLSHDSVTASTAYGALAIFLLLGQAFAALYGLIDSVSNVPFFGAEVIVDSVTYTYFSFVTLTTLGYGDLAPVTPIGQMLAVTEALVGQIYLVTVIAIVVSRLAASKNR